MGNEARAVAGWVRLDANASGDQTLLFYGQKAAGKGFWLGIDGAGELEVSGYGDSNSSMAFDANGSIKDGQWHHVAFTLDNNQTARLFVDGVQAGSRANWNINTQSPATGEYTVEVSNVAGTTTSQPVQVVIPPTILRHPESVSSTTGKTVQFSVLAPGANTYRWEVKYDGNNTFTQIPNATSPSLNLHDVRAKDHGTYRVWVGNRISPDTNSTGLTSNPANLNVILQLPEFTLQPQPHSVLTSTRVELTAQATRTEQYTWQRRINAIDGTSSWQNLTDTNGSGISTYLIANAQLGDHGVYRVMASNADGNRTSQEVAINVRLPDTLAEFSGLMGHWPFTGNGQDASGRNNHATILGGAGFVRDRLGQANGALQLDGLDDYGRVNQMSDFNFGPNQSFTLSGWVKRPDNNQTHGLDQNKTHWLLSNRLANGKPNYQLGLTPSYLATPVSGMITGTIPMAPTARAHLMGAVKAVAGGFYHNLFITEDGSLWGMGRNNRNQLGIDSAGQDVESPVLIVAGGVKAAAAGLDYTIFVKEDGSLWSVGRDWYGKLGNGSGENDQATPQMIVPNGVNDM